MVACHQLTPELAERVASSNWVLFIDAAVGDPAGEIHLSPLIPHSAAFPACSHALDPVGLMGYAKDLYGRWPSALAISVNGQEYGYTESLSRPMQASLPAALDLTELLLSCR